MAFQEKIKYQNIKNQITLEVELKKKYKDTEIEFSSVYFNSTTKRLTNHEFALEKSFQEIL